ncbi:MAG: hypothetical protein ACPGWS_07375 [Solirubrobacterales bacterium]
MSDNVTHLPKSAPPEIVEQLKASHHEIFKLSVGDEVIIVRRPTEAEYDACLDQLASASGSKHRPVAKLARQTCLWPTKEDFALILAKEPGLGLAFGEKVMGLAGIGRKAKIEKL